MNAQTQPEENKMSAGPFVLSTYITDGGTAIPIQVQPETLELTIAGVANAAPAGVTTDEFGSARVGGGNRQIGLKARSVSIKFTEGKAGYSVGSTMTLPVLNPTVWQGYSKGQTGTYLATACVVSGVPAPERRR